MNMYRSEAHVSRKKMTFFWHVQKYWDLNNVFYNFKKMCLEFQTLCSPMKTCLVTNLQAIPQFLDKAKLDHMLYPLVMTNIAMV